MKLTANAPENWWLEDEDEFPKLGFPWISGVILVLGKGLFQ